MTKKIILLTCLPLIFMVFSGCGQGPELESMTLEQLLTQGYYDTARTRVDSLWQADSTSAEALYGRGRLYEFEGYPWAAIIKYMESGQADPEFIKTVKAFVELNLEIGQYDNARTAAEYLLNLNPGIPEPYLYLARIALDNYQLDRAEALLDSAESRNADTLALYFYRVETDIRSYDPSLIGKTLEELSGYDFESSKSLALTAGIYDYLNFHDSARHYIKQAVAADSTNIDYNYRLARYLYEDNYFDDAQEAVIRLLSISAACGPGHLLDARIKKSLGRGQASELSFYEFVKLNPDLVATSEEHGDLAAEFGEPHVAIGDYEASFDRGLNLGYPPEYTRHIITKLVRYLCNIRRFYDAAEYRGDLRKWGEGQLETDFIIAAVMQFFKDVRDSARVLVDQHVDENLDNREWLQEAAWYFDVSRRDDRAEEIYRRLVELPYPSEKTYLGLLDIFEREADAEAALELVEKLPLRFVNSFPINEKLYAVFAAAGDSAHRLAYAEKLYRLSPYHLAYINTLGEEYFAAGRLVDATDLFHRFTEKYPENPHGYIAHIDFLIDHDLASEARPVVEQAMIVDSLFGGTLEAAGRYYVAVGRQDSARIIFNRLLENQYRSADAYYFLARDYYESGEELDKAAGMAMNAANLYRDKPRGLLLLGRIYYAQGKYKMARQQFARGLNSFPDNGLFDLEIGRAYIKLGYTGKARKHLNQALKSDISDEDKNEARRLLQTL